MTDETIAKSQTTIIPLRLAEPIIGKGVWPCPDDKLGRDKEIENLSPVLLNAQAPLVFALDAPWGGGKTTFIKLWQHYLAQESQQKVSIYLNAWESDFSDDPLIPLLSALDSWLSGINGKQEGEAWKKAKSIAPKILKGLAIASVKVGSMGILDASDAIEGIAAETAAGITNDIVASFNSKLSALAEFKTLLNKALDALPEDQQNLIIFVDELDRCRPTYAIEVLERIKHLFDIERIVFVLAVNRDQLSKSLQGVYGPAFDGLHYLKRFIDLDYQLREPDFKNYIRAKLSLPDIMKNFSQRNSGNGQLSDIEEITIFLALRFGYQPRDIDQFIQRLRLILRSIPSNHSLDAAVLICMLFLRQHDKTLYHKFKDDPLCVNKVIMTLLGEGFEKQKLVRPFRMIVVGLIRSCYDEYKNSLSEEIMNFWNNFYDKLGGSSEYKQEVEKIIGHLQNIHDTWELSEIRSTAFDRIELVSKIDVSR